MSAAELLESHTMYLSLRETLTGSTGVQRRRFSMTATSNRPHDSVNESPDTSAHRIDEGGSGLTRGRDRPRLVRGAQGSPLQVAAFSCSAVEEIEPQALGFTYWFEARPDGEPYSVTISCTGHRAGVVGPPGAMDSFKTSRTVDPVIPGSGRLAVTARVTDLTPGQWRVTANPKAQSQGNIGGRPQSGAARRALLPSGSASGSTAFAPVVRVRAPGVRLGAWPALVGVGAVVALAVQAILARRQDLPPLRLLAISVIASLLGVIGAKVYYLASHRGERRGLLVTGMSIQGFVLAAIGTVVVGALVTDIPVGQMLDVTVPGLLFGMATGRLGCLLGGCCVGRPTASRWGVWSSDRSVGARRIPVQLVESTVAAVVGTAALLAVLFTNPQVDGVVFLAAIAAYTFARQLLFPMRGIPRVTAHGRTVTMLICAVVLLVTVVVANVA